MNNQNNNIDPNDPYNTQSTAPATQQPQQQTVYTAPATRPYNSDMPAAEEMSIGKWMLTFLLQSIPLVGLVMLLIWAFGDPSQRRNYSRAYLLWSIIVGVLSTIFAVIYFVAIYTMMQNGAFDDLFGRQFGNAFEGFNIVRSIIRSLFR